MKFEDIIRRPSNILIYMYDRNVSKIDIMKHTNTSYSTVNKIINYFIVEGLVLKSILNGRTLDLSLTHRGRKIANELILLRNGLKK